MKTMDERMNELRERFPWAARKMSRGQQSYLQAAFELKGSFSRARFEELADPEGSGIDILIDRVRNFFSNAVLQMNEPGELVHETAGEKPMYAWPVGVIPVSAGITDIEVHGAGDPSLEIRTLRGEDVLVERSRSGDKWLFSLDTALPLGKYECELTDHQTSKAFVVEIVLDAAAVSYTHLTLPTNREE